MTNIINAKERFTPVKLDDALNEYGAQAIQALFGKDNRHKRLDEFTRQIFAENFGKLLKEHNLIYPRHFKTDVYGIIASTYGSFSTVFGGLKNPNSPNIPAEKIVWKNACELIFKKLVRGKITISKDYIYHRLTLGTSYHPVHKTPTDNGKIVASYQSCALEIDHKYSLLEQFREINDYVIDKVFDGIKRKMPSSYYIDLSYSTDIHPEFINSNLTEFFNPEYLKSLDLYGKSICDLSRNEIQLVINHFDEFESEEEVENWRIAWRCYSKELTLYLKLINRSFRAFDIPFLLEQTELQCYPHVLLGALIYEFEGEDDYHRDFLSRNSDAYGLIDPVFGTISYSTFDVINYTYLVLLPNEDMTRIVPYVAQAMGEGSWIQPLSEDVLTSSEYCYASITYPHGEKAEYNCLADLLRDGDRIKLRLIETSQNLNMHPELCEKRQKKSDFNESMANLCKPI